jgi:regulatory protein
MLVIAIYENSEKHEVTVKCSGEEYLITQADFRNLEINEGDFVSEEMQYILETAATRLACIKTAFSMLSYNDMSSGKLKRKLTQKYDKDVAAEVTEMMRERGYINDTSLALRYAESFYSSKRWGPARIRSELFSRGFSSDDINNAVENIEDMDHSENIRTLLESKYSKESLSDRDTARKAAAYLYRQGYESSDIYGIINLIYQE